jgi:hypothetical protein
MRSGPKRRIRTKLGQALELRDLSERSLAARKGTPLEASDATCALATPYHRSGLLLSRQRSGSSRGSCSMSELKTLTEAHAACPRGPMCLAYILTYREGGAVVRRRLMHDLGMVEWEQKVAALSDYTLIRQVVHGGHVIGGPKDTDPRLAFSPMAGEQEPEGESLDQWLRDGFAMLEQKEAV